MRQAACQGALNDIYGVTAKTTNEERVSIQESFDEKLVWIPDLTFNEINVIFTQNPYTFEKVCTHAPFAVGMRHGSPAMGHRLAAGHLPAD